jgi:hypothetical protein
MVRPTVQIVREYVPPGTAGLVLYGKWVIDAPKQESEMDDNTANTDMFYEFTLKRLSHEGMTTARMLAKRFEL